jgi:hypothetical protein
MLDFWILPQKSNFATEPHIAPQLLQPAGGPGAARVRIKAGLTVLTFALGEWTSHWPASPQANALYIAAWKAENGTEQGDRSRSKQTEEADK